MTSRARRPGRHGKAKPRGTRAQSKSDSVLTRVRRAERTLKTLETARKRLHGRARAALGVTDASSTGALRDALNGSALGIYGLVALGSLAAADQFMGYGLLTLSPEIGRTLGSSSSGLGSTGALRYVNLALATLPMAAAVQRRPHHRRLLIVIAAFAWSVMLGLGGAMTTAWGVMLVQAQAGQQSGTVGALHPALVMDAHPPEVRFRALSIYHAMQYAGLVIAALLIAILLGPLQTTWRAAFVVLGIVSLGAAFVAVRLRDPGVGRFDTARIREIVAEDAGRRRPEGVVQRVELGFFESLRRLLSIPTLRRVFTAQAFLGVMVLPLYTYIFTYLEDRWGMEHQSRGIFFALLNVVVIAGLIGFASEGEALFRSDPARLVHRGSVFLAIGSLALLSAVLVPVFAFMGILLAAALAAIALLTPTLGMTILSVVPPPLRPHTAALSSVFVAAVGGVGGLIVLGGVERRFGPAAAIAFLALPGLLAAWLLRKAAPSVSEDLDSVIYEIVEETELQFLADGGAHVPMLSGQNLDFSYDQVQVLFDVSLTVDEGEMVALLGTNGAGKSTLLKLISGLVMPSRGSVRLQGVNITFLDAERRLGLGITQVPGGRAVFGPLSVVENLRLFGFAHGRDRKAVEQGIDGTFEAFPALATRRNQLASTLSGGEQQMLGLGQAFMLKPKLLLIDELSLGLAPKVVGELLQIVRQINASGTAVVLVEQSVNIALTLVDHVYFMEKGEIRFDGPAQELLKRRDLLRSVFFEGAAKGMAAGSSDEVKKSSRVRSR